MVSRPCGRRRHQAYDADVELVAGKPGQDLVHTVVVVDLELDVRMNLYESRPGQLGARTGWGPARTRSADGPDIRDESRPGLHESPPPLPAATRPGGAGTHLRASA